MHCYCTALSLHLLFKCCTVPFCSPVTLQLKAALSEQSLHDYSAFLYGRFDPFWRYVIWHVSHGLLTTDGKAFLWRLQLAVFDRCSGGSRFGQVLFWYVAYVVTVVAPTYARHFGYSEMSLGVTYVKKLETWGLGRGQSNRRQYRPMSWQNLSAICTHC